MSPLEATRELLVVVLQILNRGQLTTFQTLFHIAPNTDSRCHPEGIQRVQCIGAGGRHPFWYGAEWAGFVSSHAKPEEKSHVQ
ncbi:hypothetical protein TNCV_2915691 [Trichonephila clavipes]|nr:hypothetical protein TNCV_2915691 [Trichonephila clavipes]